MVDGVHVQFSCGKGYKTRRRQCNSPRPKHGGEKCQGVKVETKQCWALARNCPSEATIFLFNLVFKNCCCFLHK